MLTVLFVFIGLLIVGRMEDELRWLHVALCLLIAGIAASVFAALGWHPNFSLAVVGVMDVILILVVFRGDIQLR